MNDAVEGNEKSGDEPRKGDDVSYEWIDCTRAQLPEGIVASEPVGLGRRFVTIEASSLGFVTLDFEQRGYRFGISYNGPVESTASYKGRGWAERLVADAVAALRGVQ